jgi:hypothetical protein
MSEGRKPLYDLSKVNTPDLELPGSRHPPPPHPSSKPPAKKPRSPWKGWRPLSRPKIQVRPPRPRAPTDPEPSHPEEDIELPTQTNLGFAVNALLAIVGLAGASYPLVRFVHRAAGWNVLRFARVILEQRSLLWASVAAIASVAVTIGFGIAARYVRPKSAGYLVVALAMFLVAFTMMFIVLTPASGGEGAEAQPDAAPLLRWAIPFVPLGLASRTLANLWRRCGFRGGAGRLVATLHGALTAALFFVAVELFFGAGLGRLFAWLHH